MTDPRFPGAPEGSYVCEEGWLIVGDEAWTPREWALEKSARYDRERRQSPARREKLREYLRRYRDKRRAAA